MDTEQLFLGKYRIIKILGQGGMSKVYLAENVNLETQWAIKEIKKNKNQHVDLLAEPKALKNLRHPSLPRIFDINENDEFLYIIQDYIEGEDLSDIISQNGAIEESRVIKWAKQITEVYIYLHNLSPNPLIYRDMKPGNLIIDKDDNVKIIDFGIAREFKTGSTEDTTMLGTRGYAAPEQYGTTQTDTRSDIYSLGITLYHLLTGVSPNSATFDTKTLEQDSHVSNGMSNVLQKCIENNPAKRFQSAEELMDALENIHQWNTKYKENTNKKTLLKATTAIASAVGIIQIGFFTLKLKMALGNKAPILMDLIGLIIGFVLSVIGWSTYQKHQNFDTNNAITDENTADEEQLQKKFGKLQIKTKPVMAFISPRSTGKTELACNTALALSKMGKKTILLDLDHKSYGTIYNFPVDPGENFENYYKFRILVNRVENYLKGKEKELTNSEIKSMAIHSQKNLHVYSGNQEVQLKDSKPEINRRYKEHLEPELLKSDLPQKWIGKIKDIYIEENSMADEKALEYLIRKLNNDSDVLVIDVGKNVSQATMNLLVRSEYIEKYLITTENLEDLNSIAHQIPLEQDVDYDNWNLVVNKIKNKPMFGNRELKKFFYDSEVEFLKFRIKEICHVPTVSDIWTFKRKRKCIIGYSNEFDNSIENIIKASKLS